MACLVLHTVHTEQHISLLKGVFVCVCAEWLHLLLLQVMKTLLSPLQTLQVLHHLLHVVLGVAVLDIGEPAATHSYDYRHHQHEVLQMVMPVHCSGEEREKEREEGK